MARQHVWGQPRLHIKTSKKQTFTKTKWKCKQGRKMWYYDICHMPLNGGYTIRKFHHCAYNLKRNGLKLELITKHQWLNNNAYIMNLHFKKNTKGRIWGASRLPSIWIMRNLIIHPPFSYSLPYVSDTMAIYLYLKHLHNKHNWILKRS